ncbi:MAG TPA: IS91 family transposase, partial [Bacteroidetes bacterium]|nr:IS91 family transposase [Bacteroidota bacterium]
MTPDYKVADVLNLEREQLSEICNNKWKLRALHAIRKCRTVDLGVHIDKCDSCGKIQISYNSCRNRHCPTCQGHKIEQWIHARELELLPVKYFHVVFTIPDKLNDICLKHPKVIYSILFKTAWQTLQQFGDNPKHLGAKLGMIAVLHTWGQNLSLHPHLHCIVPGGGISNAGYWKNAKNKGKYLFNVKAMSKVFRAKFVSELRKQLPEVPQSLYDKLFEKKWVVFAKHSLLSPKSIIEYLGRYTHKVAISNYRILNIDKEKREVTFSLKDYRKKGKKITLTLDFVTFIKRFSLHILPKGFTKIRHYGFLSTAWKKVKLPELQLKLFGHKIEKNEYKPVTKLMVCPFCKTGKLVTILAF